MDDLNLKNKQTRIYFFREISIFHSSFIACKIINYVLLIFNHVNTVIRLIDAFIFINNSFYR